MIDPLVASIRTAGSGLDAQAARIRIVSENIANAQTTGSSPDADPYTRKTITFSDALSRADGANLVKVRTIGTDPSAFRIVRDPGHPAANEKGDVKMPNVDPLIEIADMRDANRGYQANIQVVKQARDLISMTIDLLKS